MKASIIASILALSTSALASPLLAREDLPVKTLPVSLFTFSITNDKTGVTAASSVAIGSAPKSFKDLFYPWAPLIREDMIIATSAMNLNSAVAGVKCTIKGWGREMELSERMTFAELDNAPGEAKETDVTGFTIACVQ